MRELKFTPQRMIGSIALPLLLAVLMTCSSAKVFSQIIPDSLSLKPQRFTYEVYQGPLRVGPNRIRTLMKECPRPLSYYENGRTYEKLGTTMMAIGAVFTIVGAGNYFLNGKEELSYTTLGAGLLFVGLSIPTISAGRKRIATSIYLFNKECAIKK